MSGAPTTPDGTEKTGFDGKVDDTVAVLQVLPDGKGALNEDGKATTLRRIADSCLHLLDYTPSEYARLLRKIDRFLLPLMYVETSRSQFRFFSGIQQTDKTSLGNQAIFGLRTDAHLRGQEYQWLTTVFYMTYLLGEFPSNFLLQRWALGRTLTIYMLCWGICVISIAAAQNWTHLMIIRALQGFFECTISPGFVLIVGTWYRTEEHASRALFWQSANAGFGIISDLSMYAIGLHAKNHPGGLAPWRGISLFLGSATIICAILCIFLLGSPKEVRWLSAEDKKYRVRLNDNRAARILKNKAGRDITGIKWDWSQVTEAFIDPQLYFCVFNAFLSSVPNGGLATFGSIMYARSQRVIVQVLLVGIPRSVVSVLIFLAVGIFTRRVKNMRMWVMASAMIPPFIGLLTLSLLPNEPQFKWTKWGMYLMTVPFVLALFLAWTLSEFTS
ncbi:major facilitator superfamily domain-containing protein [Mycena sp. CBHHK59/15]|nr:major facilitator superfamily domain-containing protein [Mycena sp. CBHHK59/15]